MQNKYIYIPDIHPSFIYKFYTELLHPCLFDSCCEGSKTKENTLQSNRFKCIYHLQLLEMLDENRFKQIIVSFKSCSLGSATFLELTSNNYIELDFIIWALPLSPYLLSVDLPNTLCNLTDA